MGLLAETKSRRSINKDPNNTKWSRDINTFGQKILRQQGWQPGQFLGAQDAPHAELHSAASASYIRVALKDDMKGLGFDRAKQDEGAGMDAFKDLLSRLNGKSADVVESEKLERMAVKTNRWVEMKYGAMRFVKGGLLVGDEVKEVEEEEEEEPARVVEVTEEKSKKRKAESLSEDKDEEQTSRETDTKSKKRRRDETDSERKARRKEKKAKKNKPSSSSDEDSPERTTTTTSTDLTASSSSSSEPESSSERKRLKKERKLQKREAKEKKKEDKRQRKEEKKRRKLGGGSSSTVLSTPAESGTSTPVVNPHFVRARFIASKRKAMMDPKALDQILMLKV